MAEADVAQVDAAFASTQPAWFPGLAGLLIEGWQLQSGMAVSSYGTSRFVGGPGCLPRWTHDLQVDGRILTRLEVLSPEVDERYTSQGLRLLTPEEAVGSSKKLFGLALNVQTMPNSLLGAVLALAKVTHLLRSAGDGMDTSHSDPDLPFSIFVSVPEPGERYGAFRLGEGFVHEAMHLQLSLIEQISPLVVEAGATYYSPWREQHRPLGGVLHGLYVFAVIHQWLSGRGTGCAYARRRLPEIRKEIGRLSGFPDAEGLTRAGAQLARRLIDSVRSSP